jgi:hypothetical protein
LHLLSKLLFPSSANTMSVSLHDTVGKRVTCVFWSVFPTALCRSWIYFCFLCEEVTGLANNWVHVSKGICYKCKLLYITFLFIHYTFWTYHMFTSCC